MRLIAHNMLKCNKKGVSNGYPLKIECIDKQVIQSSYNKDMMKKVIFKVQLEGLKSAIMDLSLLTIEELDSLEKNIDILRKLYIEDDFSDVIDEAMEDTVLNTLHHLLFEIHILDGALVCPESGRSFPIKESIPNMILHEDEV